MQKVLFRSNSSAQSAQHGEPQPVRRFKDSARHSARGIAVEINDVRCTCMLLVPRSTDRIYACMQVCEAAHA